MVCGLFAAVGASRRTGAPLLQAKHLANALADRFWAAAEMNQCVNDDAARFDGIEQTEARRRDDEPPNGRFINRRDFGVLAKVASNRVTNSSPACSRRDSSSAKICSRSFSAPCFQTMSAIAALQQPFA